MKVFTIIPEECCRKITMEYSDNIPMEECRISWQYSYEILKDIFDYSYPLEYCRRIIRKNCRDIPLEYCWIL